MGYSCRPEPCLYKCVRWVCVGICKLLRDVCGLTTGLSCSSFFLLRVVSSLIIDMTVGRRAQTQEAVENPYKKDDVAECTHVERRCDEPCMNFNENPEVGHNNSDQIDKKLVRKLDWVILPVLWVMYWFK